MEYAKSVNVVLERVPAHATSVCQPADVAWMKPFKDRLRNQWVDSLREQLTEREAGTQLSVPGHEHIAKWVRNAWEAMGMDIIKNGYRRCDLLVDPVEQDAADLVEKLKHLELLDNVIDSIDSDDDIDRDNRNES